MEPTPFSELKPGTKYYIVTIDSYYPYYYIKETRVSEGIFMNYTPNDEAVFKNPISNRKRNLPKIELILFGHYYSCGLDSYTYYDADLIKQNATRAKENREKRTINMILRTIIGDQSFEW
jgi:hypothetical protein